MEGGFNAAVIYYTSALSILTLRTEKTVLIYVDVSWLCAFLAVRIAERIVEREIVITNVVALYGCYSLGRICQSYIYKP